jgi:hypothetical protein
VSVTINKKEICIQAAMILRTKVKLSFDDKYLWQIFLKKFIFRFSCNDSSAVGKSFKMFKTDGRTANVFIISIALVILRSTRTPNAKMPRPIE